MAIKLTKLLSVLAIILVHFFFLPELAWAEIVKFNTNSTVIVAQIANSSPQMELTPQMRQQLQAVRQRRNREIMKVLDSSQITQLNQNLRTGDNFAQALAKLELQGEQKELVEAIAKISDLKIKRILSRYSLQTSQKY
ncbi:hypothetical protein ACF3DV_08605 [Chlorogloeopsis fritschii PCC 9212]|jgi:hypothetical protein|uniref:DUF4168 domain-containing protein n=1 Tax=Chlorogloeopsis fritschii PCC 6912 TaxID=211165 RepID=A0A433MYV0_CHLFR|nr:hypothetical protein [Chlorogloeopsis fritschii]MBF2006105.1 hypothetical protein [Chlorogloeopsis fritschii C42_A2020_084]RUR73566.1 hypothetical protein PCC6912_55640 [Chlorogloeopsis fritschii PCC 6912]